MLKALRYFDVIPPIRCLASTLGDDLPDVLSAGDAQLLKSACSLSDAYVRALLSAFPDQDSIDRLRAASILSAIGASTPTITQALAMPHVLSLLRDEPFETMRVLGGSLDEAMALAGSLKKSNDVRALGFISWKLTDYSRQGHTLIHRNMVESRIPQTIVERLVAQGKIMRRGDYIQGGHEHALEVTIAQEIKRRVNTSSVFAWNTEVALTKMHLTPTQKTAVDMVCSSLFSVITGLPGSGKTHVARALQKCIPHSLLIAPTGRAVSENYHARCPVQELTTIPEDTKLLFIDDSSMLSTALLHKALVLAPESCHVVLLGDINQLLPIDPGFPLRDILKSGVCPVTSFDVAHRQVFDASCILEGTLPDDICLIETTDENATVAEVVRCFKYEGGTVLHPLRSGRDRINTACQYLVHGQMRGTMKQTSGIAEGRVVHLEMSDDDITCVASAELMPTIFLHIGDVPYMVEPLPPLIGDTIISAHQGLDVCIGDMGTLTGIHGELVSFQKFGADSVCDSLIPKASFDKAYALTVHKAQGSEFLTVVLPALHSYDWTRRLLYTAATRARINLSLVGPRAFWEAALTRVDPERLTGLAIELLS